MKLSPDDAYQLAKEQEADARDDAKTPPLKIRKEIAELIPRLIALQEAEGHDVQDFGVACLHVYLTFIALDVHQGEISREHAYRHLGSVALIGMFDAIFDNMQRIGPLDA